MMMRPTHLLTAALLLATGACTVVTTATAPPEQDAEVRLQRGLRAVDAGEYRTAFNELAWVYARCAGYQRGLHALAGLAAVELDPRNRSGRPGVGSDLMGRLLTDPRSPEWVLPLAESSYLMALALGAPEATTAAPDTTVPADTSAAPDTSDGAAAMAKIRPPEDTTAASVRVPRAAGALGEAEGEPAHGCGPAVDVDEHWVAPALPTLPGPSLLSLLSEMEAARDSASARAQALSAEIEALRQRLAETEQELERIRRTLRP